jgi:hypothetical protein
VSSRGLGWTTTHFSFIVVRLVRSDLPKFLNMLEAWNKVGPYHSISRRNLFIAFKGLNDENTKVS